MSSPKVYYTVGGKHDPSGLNSLKQSMAQTTASFTTGLKSITSLFTPVTAAIAAATAALGVMKKVVKETSEAFVKQNKEINKMQFAFELNANLTEGAAQRITKAIDSIPSIFDEDQIHAQTAYLSNLKLNEEQIKKVMKTAMDLEASGVMPLEQAVKSLSQSYNGTITQLKKICPAVAELTEEEIKHGKAVDLVMQQYDGFTKKVANTYGGMIQQNKNAVSNFKAAWGGFFVSWGASFRNEFTPMFKDMTKNIERIRKEIEPFLQWWGKTCANNIRVAFEGIRTAINLILAPIRAVIKLCQKLYGWIKDKIVSALEETTDGQKWLKRMELFWKIWENLPGIVSDSLQLVSDLINDTFSGDNFITAAKNFGLIFINGIKIGWAYVSNYLSLAFTSLAEWGTVIMTNVKYWALNLGDRIWNSILYAINLGLKGLVNTKLGKSIYSLITGDDYQEGSDVISYTFNEKYRKSNGMWQERSKINPNYYNNIGQVATFEKANEIIAWKLDQVKNNINTVKKESFEAILDSGNKLWSIYGDSIKQYQQSVVDRINGTGEQVVNAIGDAKEDLIENDYYEVPETTTTVTTEPETEEAKSLWQTILSDIGEFITSIEAVQKLQKWWMTIVEGAFEILEPAINNILNPFVDCLKILGRTIGIILMPMFEGLAVIMDKAIMPALIWFAKGLDWVLGGLVKGINALIKGINKSMGWLGVKIGEIQYTSIAEQIASLGQSQIDTSLGSATGGSASYQAARDVYVNVYYTNSYVNGDTRQIALNIRDEIIAAERLGY